MPSNREPKIGSFSAFSIGIGGMVGGGIFAVTGLTIELTRGAAPVAFIVAGIVALLTSYSYMKLTFRYPSVGGTVEYLNRAFGSGVLTGSANISILGTITCAIALAALCWQTFDSPETKNEIWILVGMIVISLLVELIYRGITKRKIHMGHPRTD